MPVVIINLKIHIVNNDQDVNIFTNSFKEFQYGNSRVLILKALRFALEMEFHAYP